MSFAPPSPAALSCFESTALPYMKDLFRAALSMLGDRTEAEDAVQEAYLRAWRAFDRFEPGTNCKAWLFKILVNIVRNHRRSWFVRSRGPELDLETLEETSVYAPPVVDGLTDEQILGALSSLPQAFSEAILLVDVQELSYKEASGALEIPIGTVMSRLSRGRRMLREKLAVVGISSPAVASVVA